MSCFRCCRQNWLFSVMFFSASLCIFALIIAGFSFNQSKSLVTQNDRNTGTIVTPQSLTISSLHPIEQNCDGYHQSINKQKAGGVWQSFNRHVDFVFDQTRKFLNILDEKENSMQGNKIKIEDVGNYSYVPADNSFEKLPTSSLHFSEISSDSNDGSFQAELRLKSEWGFNVNITSSHDPSTLIGVRLIPRNVVISLTKKPYDDLDAPFENLIYKSFDQTIKIDEKNISADGPPLDNLITIFKKRLMSMISEQISNHTQHKLLKFYHEEYRALECSIINSIPFRKKTSDVKKFFMENFCEIQLNSDKWKLQQVVVSKWPDLKSTKIVFLENNTIELHLKMTNSTIYVTANLTDRNNITKEYKNIALHIGEVFVTLTRNGNVTEKAEIRFERLVAKNLTESVDQMKEALETSMEFCLKGKCF